MLNESEAFEQDERAGMAYLGGYLETDKKGIPRHRYHPERSEKSDFCRAALARVLRSEEPLNRQLREMLADMFEPTAPLLSACGWRKLTAGFRRKPRDHHASTYMSWFVWQRAAKEEGVESAIKEAMEVFDVSRERMYDLWKTYKPLFEAIYGPLRPSGER